MGVEVAMEVVAEVEVDVETYCGLAPGPRARRKRGSRCRNSPSTPRATARMRPSRDWSTMLPRTASPADCSRVRVARSGPSGSGSSWTYSWMPTGKPARSSWVQAQYAASWKAPSSASGSIAHCGLRGSREGGGRGGGAPAARGAAGRGGRGGGGRAPPRGGLAAGRPARGARAGGRRRGGGGRGGGRGGGGSGGGRGAGGVGRAAGALV